MFIKPYFFFEGPNFQRVFFQIWLTIRPHFKFPSHMWSVIRLLFFKLLPLKGCFCVPKCAASEFNTFLQWKCYFDRRRFVYRRRFRRTFCELRRSYSLLHLTKNRNQKSTYLTVSKSQLALNLIPNPNLKPKSYVQITAMPSERFNGQITRLSISGQAGSLVDTKTQKTYCFGAAARRDFKLERFQLVSI